MRKVGSEVQRVGSEVREVGSGVREVGSGVRRVGGRVRRVGSAVRRVGSEVREVGGGVPGLDWRSGLSLAAMRFLLAALLALSGAASAQTLAWERVGDRPVSASSPSIAPDGTMWATGLHGLFRLPPPYGPAATWTQVSPNFGGQNVIALGQDTLVVIRAYPNRSTDNGQTFQQMSFPNITSIFGLYEIPAGLPHAGTLVGEAYGPFAVLSRDRGATWARATIPNSEPEDPGAASLAVVLRGPRAGRIIGAGFWGLATSDDGGASYTPVTGLWEYFRFLGGAVGVLDGAAPDGGDRIVATIIDPPRPGRDAYVLVSDDGGDTWRETFALTGDPNATTADVVDFGGGRAVIAMDGGEVWQTDDAGESWTVVGIVPGALLDPAGSPTSGRVMWAMRGPDGRLYAGGDRLGGSNPGWTFRTVLPVVAGEAGPSEAPARLGLSVRPNPAGGRVEVALTLVEASAARVVVVDALGREVAAVLDGAVAAGERVAALDTSGWPAGVYVVRAAVGGQTATARLVVAR